jgi:hypothetical protein
MVQVEMVVDVESVCMLWSDLIAIFGWVKSTLVDPLCFSRIGKRGFLKIDDNSEY